MRKWKWKLLLFLLIGIVIEIIWLILVLVIPKTDKGWYFGWFWGFGNGILIFILILIFIIRFIFKRRKKPEGEKIAEKAQFTREQAERKFVQELMHNHSRQPSVIKGKLRYEGKSTKQPIYVMETSDLYIGEKYYGIMNLVSGQLSIENYESLFEKEKITESINEMASMISEEPETRLMRRVRIIDSETGTERIIEEPLGETEIIKQKQIQEEKKEVLGGEEK